MTARWALWLLLLAAPSARADVAIATSAGDATPRWLVGQLVEPSCAGKRSARATKLPPQVSSARLYGVRPDASLYGTEVVVAGRPTSLRAADAWCTAAATGPAAWESTSVTQVRLLEVDWRAGTLLMRVRNPLPVAISLGLVVNYERCGSDAEKSTLKIPAQLVAPNSVHTFTVQTGPISEFDAGPHQVTGVRVVTGDPRVVWDLSTPIVISGVDQCVARVGR